jgi:hypothetical protein
MRGVATLALCAHRLQIRLGFVPIAIFRISGESNGRLMRLICEIDAILYFVLFKMPAHLFENSGELIRRLRGRGTVLRLHGFAQTRRTRSDGLHPLLKVRVILCEHGTHEECRADRQSDYSFFHKPPVGHDQLSTAAHRNS